MDWIITGASRGIGRSLVLALGKRATGGDRLFVVARDLERLRSLARDVGEGAEVVPLDADLSRVGEARAVGERLAKEVRPGAVLVHNAGLWPSQRELVDGVERAFATNCLGLLALQGPLLQEKRLSRVMVVGAGLMIKGRFHEEKTPLGHDFSAFRTYCTTKLAGAVAMRKVAQGHPEVDLMVVHPGVVNTDLGMRRGLLGILLRIAKRGWETPETCAARLVRLLDRPTWQHTKGDAPWFVEENETAWPAVATQYEQAILAAVKRVDAGLLG